VCPRLAVEDADRRVGTTPHPTLQNLPVRIRDASRDRVGRLPAPPLEGIDVVRPTGPALGREASGRDRARRRDARLPWFVNLFVLRVQDDELLVRLASKNPGGHEQEKNKETHGSHSFTRIIARRLSGVNGRKRGTADERRWTRMIEAPLEHAKARGRRFPLGALEGRSSEAAMCPLCRYGLIIPRHVAGRPPRG